MGKVGIAPLTSDKFLDQDEDIRFHEILAKYSNRDTLILGLLRRYGMRSGELLAVTPNDLDRSAKTLFVRGTKGSRDRLMPLTDDFFNRLVEHADTVRLPDQRIFDLSYSRLYEIWNFYRPAKKKLHSLRHTFAIDIYRKTKKPSASPEAPWPQILSHH